MPDPNLVLAAIQTHAAALEGAVKFHAGNAARCRVAGAAIVAGMMLFVVAKAQMAALPWMAGVVGLLAVADAGQVALARVFTDAYNRLMRELPLNGGRAVKAEDCLLLPAPVLGLRQAGLVLGALGSFSVWPFYGALLALLLGFHYQNSQAAMQGAPAPPKVSPGVYSTPPSISGKPKAAGLPGQPVRVQPSSPGTPGGPQPPQPGTRVIANPAGRVPANLGVPANGVGPGSLPVVPSAPLPQAPPGPAGTPALQGAAETPGK